MPAITIKVFERELTWGQAAELIEDVTNAVVPFVGEAVRSKRLGPDRESNTEENRIF